MNKGLLALALGLSLLSMMQAQRELKEMARSKLDAELVTSADDNVKNVPITDSSAKDPAPPGLNPEGGGAKKSTKSALKVVRRPTPHYPSSSMENKEEGRVVIRLVVLPSGKIDSAVVAQSSGYPALDQAALKAAEGIIFKPGEDNTSSGSVILRVPYDFKLRRK